MIKRQLNDKKIPVRDSGIQLQVVYEGTMQMSSNESNINDVIGDLTSEIPDEYNFFNIFFLFSDTRVFIYYETKTCRGQYSF